VEREAAMLDRSRIGQKRTGEDNLVGRFWGAVKKVIKVAVRRDGPCLCPLEEAEDWLASLGQQRTHEQDAVLQFVRHSLRQQNVAWDRCWAGGWHLSAAEAKAILGWLRVDASEVRRGTLRERCMAWFCGEIREQEVTPPGDRVRPEEFARDLARRTRTVKAALLCASDVADWILDVQVRLHDVRGLAMNPLLSGIGLTAFELRLRYLLGSTNSNLGLLLDVRDLRNTLYSARTIGRLFDEFETVAQDDPEPQALARYLSTRLPRICEALDQLGRIDAGGST